MRKIFIPTLEDMKKYENEIINDEGFLFCVENDAIIIKRNLGKSYSKLIEIDIPSISEIPDCTIQEKYSIINELLLPFSFGVRYSKKEM